MSIDIMNRIWWRTDLPTMEKFVGLALADSSNEHGMCWPAIDTIAQKCSCSARTVQNAIRGLEGKQLVKVVPRKDRTSYYVFNMANLPHVERPRRAKEAGPHEALTTGAGDSPDLFEGVNLTTGTGESGSVTGAGDSPKPSIEPSVEPSSISSAPMSDSDIAALYVDLWNAMAERVERISAIGKLGDKRKASLLARVDEYVPKRARAEVEYLLKRIIATIEGSRFCRGEVKSFKASPDWALTPTYFPKLEETGYAQDATADGGLGFDSSGRSHVAAGQAARDILHAGGGTARRSARELAGGRPRRVASAD